MAEEAEDIDGCEVQQLAFVSEDKLRVASVNFCAHAASLSIFGEDLTPGLAAGMARAWVEREFIPIPSALKEETERMVEGYAHRN